MAIASCTSIFVKSREYLPTGGSIVLQHFAPAAPDIRKHRIPLSKTQKRFIQIKQDKG